MTQFDLFGGRSDRDIGMAKASRSEQWAVAAYAAIVRLAKQQAEVHVDDVLCSFSLRPHHYNAWGAIWLKAVREGVLENTGRMRQTAHRKKHAHQYPIYRSLIFR